jgi:parallel beta-helix repeat protein
VISDINIPAGVSIVFEAGAKVEFVNSTGIYVHGSLSINGMADDPVTLVSVGGGTSSYWDRNGFEWEGLYLHNDAANVDINYAYISFARWGVYFDNTGGHVANSIFKENEYGIYIDGASAPVIEDNTIVQNRIGFYLNGYSADPDPTVVRNDIYANTQYNLHLYNIDNNTILNFSNNWWGTDVIADIRATIHTAGTTDQYASLLLDSIASEANQSLIPYNIAINGRYISPATSSGIQDNVTLSASLGQSAPWAIEVVNSSGLTVRNFSGTGDSIHIDWDGTSNSANNVPDDVYTFVFVASSSLHMGRVVLDNTLPAAHFASGIDGSMINTGQVLLEGIASDDYFSSYRVEYGAGASPSTWTLIDSIKTVPVTSGNLVSWIVADDGAMEPLLDGIYSIRLTVNDLAGNSSLEVIQVTINTLSIHSVSQDLVTFNPIGGESARVSFTINDPAIVTLKIASQIDGSIVRSVSQNYTTAGDHYLEWDGLDDNGQYVVDEAYLYTLVAEDGVRQASYSPEFVPEVGQITGDNRISYSVSKNNFWKNYVNLAYSSRVKLCIGTQQSMPDIDCDSAGQYVAIDNEPYEAGNHWLYWDGRVEGGDALKGKDHKFHLAAIETLPPNTIIVKGNIPSLRGESGTAPNIEIKSNPYKVRHSYDEVSTVKYIIDQNSYITIKLLPPDINDPADSSAIVLVSEQLQMAEESPGIPATYMFEWKGYDDSVPVPDTNNIVIDTNGRYTFTIQATSAETGYSTLYRGSLRLYH